MIGAKYIDHMGTDLTVVNSARVSFGKEVTQLDEKDVKLIDYLAKNKHLTPFEHCSLTVKVDCPLYIRSQIMRHRTFSYNEISRRYTSENLQFYVPDYRKQHAKSKQCSDGDLNKDTNELLERMTHNIHKECLDLYNSMVDNGVAREQARGILPQNLMTEFYMSGSLRNWIHFLTLRLDSHAQEEARIVALDIKQIIDRLFPESSKSLLAYTK